MKAKPTSLSELMEIAKKPRSKRKTIRKWRTRKKPKPKTCELCGLSNADNEKKPADAKIVPCRFCKRNPKAEARITDFHSETWTLLSDNTPTIEDPDPHEQALLRILHDVVNIYC